MQLVIRGDANTVIPALDPQIVSHECEELRASAEEALEVSCPSSSSELTGIMNTSIDRACGARNLEGIPQQPAMGVTSMKQIVP